MQSATTYSNNKALPLLSAGSLAFGAPVKVGSEKRADPQPGQPEIRFPGDDTNPDALRRVLSIGLTGLGAGVGARSLLGLKDMFANSYARPPRPMRPAVVEVAVPQAVEDEQEEDPRFAQRSLGMKAAEGPAPSVFDVAGDKLMSLFKSDKPQPPEGSVTDFLSGRLNVAHMGKPWFLPAALGAGGAGLYGGYKGVDALLNQVKKRNRASELEAAKEEYRKALVQQYSPGSVKQAEEKDELASDLDELYQMYKQAFGMNEAAGYLGGPSGAYLAAAGLLSGGVGLATYNWAKGRSPDERLAKAIKQRERLRWATRPPEIYAVAKPTPVRVAEADQFSPGSAADEATVRKYAATVASLYKP